MGASSPTRRAPWVPSSGVAQRDDGGMAPALLISVTCSMALPPWPASHGAGARWWRGVGQVDRPLREAGAGGLGLRHQRGAGVARQGEQRVAVGQQLRAMARPMPREAPVRMVRRRKWGSSRQSTASAPAQS
jgi:hypothetical protein